MHVGTYSHGSEAFSAVLWVDGVPTAATTAFDSGVTSSSYPGADQCVTNPGGLAINRWFTVTVSAGYGSHALTTTDSSSYGLTYLWHSYFWGGSSSVSLTFGFLDSDGDGIGDHEDDCPYEDPATYYGYDVADDGCISDLVGTGCPLARAEKSNDTDFNNMADEWGVLARANATLSGATEGSLRVFGDGDLYSFNVGTDPINPNSYAGKGDLYARSGNFAKNVRAASVDADTSVSIGGSTTESMFDGHISRYMNKLSTDMGNHNINGSTTVQSWGTVEFSGSHPMMNTFEVSAADFAASTYMTISVPAGSSAIINVTGTSATFGPVGVTLSTGVDATDVVYNFPDAMSLELDGVSVVGQLVAPRADIDIVSGDITGTMTGKDIDGTITQYNASFDGRACAVVEAAGGPDCSVTHTVTNSWSGGYNATVTITNVGDAASSWSADWTFGNGESVSGGWGGTYSQSGADVSVSNASWNGAIAAGGSVTIGYTGSGTPDALASYSASCE